MSFKIAVASTDDIYVDAHFGSAASFLIYEVNSDGSYEKKEERIVLGKTGDISSDSTIPSEENEKTRGSNSERVQNTDCASSSNCASDSDCSSKSGCGSSDGSGGGGCGGHSGHSDTKIESNISLIADCRCLLCYKVGAGAERQLERKAITVFQVDYKVEDALKKIINYYTKIDNHLSLRNAK